MAFAAASQLPVSSVAETAKIPFLQIVTYTIYIYMKERIKQLMESQHMNQQSFASFIGVAPATLSSILRERTRPTLDTVDSICRKMPNVNLVWLLNGTGDMFLTGGTPHGNGGQAGDGSLGGMTAGADGQEGSLDPSGYGRQSAGDSLSGASAQAYGQSSGSQQSSPAPSASGSGSASGGAAQGILGFSFDTNDSPSPSAARQAAYGGQRRGQQRQEEFNDGAKKIDKPTRRITEIRVFYDDQTWESFVPKK